jgi:hypothetical protein
MYRLINESYFGSFCFFYVTSSRLSIEHLCNPDLSFFNSSSGRMKKDLTCTCRSCGIEASIITVVVSSYQNQHCLLLQQTLLQLQATTPCNGRARGTTARAKGHLKYAERLR